MYLNNACGANAMVGFGAMPITPFVVATLSDRRTTKYGIRFTNNETTSLLKLWSQHEKSSHHRPGRLICGLLG